MARAVLWTEEEDAFLRANFAGMTARELNEGLKHISPVERGTENMRHRCKILGFRPKSAGRHVWTGADDDFVMVNRASMTHKEIAMALGVSAVSVNSRAEKLRNGSGKMKRQTPWMESMVEKIEGLGKSVYEVAHEFWQAGVKVDIEENDDGHMAAFARIRS